jgi:hypothetical protein
MTTNGPPDERARPPKVPHRVVNRIMGWLLPTSRRSSRVGRHLLQLHITGRISGRWFAFPAAPGEVANDRLEVLARFNVSNGPTLVEPADTTGRDGLALICLDIARASQ